MTKTRKTALRSKRIFVIGFFILVVATVTIAIAVTLSGSSDEVKNDTTNMNPMLSFFHITDGMDIKWAHAVNSRNKLIQSINGGEVMFLEADVMLNPTMDHAIMAHPPATTGDITLREWLDIALKTSKGIKLDVKQTIALNYTKVTLEKLVSKYPLYKGPILLNADILAGPNNNITKPVNANKFLNTVRNLKTMVLSPGWTTGYIGNSSTGYSMDHVQKMNELVKDLSQFITFPVRASLVGRSKQPLLWLLNQNKMKYSFTVWTSSKESYDVKSLSFLRSYPENVFFDLPDNEIEILENLDES